MEDAMCIAGTVCSLVKTRRVEEGRGMTVSRLDLECEGKRKL